MFQVFVVLLEVVILWHPMWSLLYILLSRLQTVKFSSDYVCMLLEMLFIASVNSVTLSVAPWEMPFSSFFSSERLSLILTRNFLL